MQNDLYARETGAETLFRRAVLAALLMMFALSGLAVLALLYELIRH